MTRADILQSIADDPEIKTACRRIVKDSNLAEDLYQELFVILCESPQLEKIHSEGWLRHWIVRILTNQTQHKRKSGGEGQFRKKFCQPFEPLNRLCPSDWDIQMVSDSESETNFPDPDDGSDSKFYNEALDFIEAEIKKEDSKDKIYCNALVVKYVELGSVRAVSRVSNIPHVSLNDTMNRFRKELKRKFHDSDCI